MIHSPQDTVYKILSREISYETEAIVFFVRDYSGSMQGSPSEAVLTQHLFLYSWLMYHYDKRVKTRFILHDTQAIEAEDFSTYYRSNVAGGTKIFPGMHVKMGKDHTIFSLIKGKVHFKKSKSDRTFVSVKPN